MVPFKYRLEQECKVPERYHVRVRGIDGRTWLGTGPGPCMYMRLRLAATQREVSESSLDLFMIQFKHALRALIEREPHKWATNVEEQAARWRETLLARSVAPGRVDGPLGLACQFLRIKPTRKALDAFLAGR